MSATCLTRRSTFATRAAAALVREAMSDRGPLRGCIVGEPEDHVVEDKRGRPIEVVTVQTIYDRRTFKAVGQLSSGIVTWYATPPTSRSARVDPKSFATIRRRRRSAGPAAPSDKVVAVSDWPEGARKP